MGEVTMMMTEVVTTEEVLTGVDMAIDEEGVMTLDITEGAGTLIMKESSYALHPQVCGSCWCMS